jgi:putative ABC transport system permease protein
VQSAASSAITPLSGRGWAQPIYPEGTAAKSPREMLVFLNRVSPRYFETLSTPIIAGRDFSDRDTLAGPRVMVIGESTAKRFFADGNAIGRSIALTRMGGPEQKIPYTVIGVVKDAKYANVTESPRRTGFLSSLQDPDPAPEINYEVRFSGPAQPLTASVRAAISDVNRELSVEFHRLDQQVADSIHQPRLVAWLSATFGAIALALAMVGLYGITSYAVNMRRSEIGIRMALGAQRRGLILLIVGDVGVLLAIGLVMGFAGSLALGRSITSLLYGVRPNDPAQLAGAAAVLVIGAMIAAYLPARRAATMDPMSALRQE